MILDIIMLDIRYKIQHIISTNIYCYPRNRIYSAFMVYGRNYRYQIDHVDSYYSFIHKLKYIGYSFTRKLMANMYNYHNVRLHPRRI